VSLNLDYMSGTKPNEFMVMSKKFIALYIFLKIREFYVFAQNGF